jgi:hypothetical protein
LQAIADWLGQDWLEQETGNHPLQQLWKDPTHQSSVELFNLGFAIRQQRELVGNQWFIDERSKARQYP